jgi:DNA uptake protein ComE-like DNA-binding protein
MHARMVAIVLFSLAGTAAAQVGTSKGLLDANTAPEAELRGANVGAALAAKIIAARPIAGAAALDQLLAATLGEPQREQLYGRLFVTINLNTASRAEILLIPGMTERMAHEFEEYRPYTSLEQFRREIGKYVDQNEVARLE